MHPQPRTTLNHDHQVRSRDPVEPLLYGIIKDNDSLGLELAGTSVDYFKSGPSE